MSSAVIESITNSLNKMEEEGKVDLSIVNTLDELNTYFRQIQDKWLRSKEREHSFYFYYATRNAQLVIEKMKDRFLTSQTNKDNPQIAEDSLVLVPILGDLLQLTDRDTANAQLANRTIERVRQLRAIAYDVRLLPSPNKELEQSDKKKVAKKIDEIMNIVGPSYDAL